MSALTLLSTTAEFSRDEETAVKATAFGAHAAVAMTGQAGPRTRTWH